MTGTNPHSWIRKAATYMGGVTGISAAGIFDPTEFDPKTAPIAADLVVIDDSEATNAPKIVTFANVCKAIGPTLAGTVGSTGLTNTAGVLTVAPADTTIVPADDSLVFMTAAGAPKKELFKHAIGLMVGTSSATGLAQADGVVTVTPSDATIDIAADSIQYVTAGGVPKKELVSHAVALIAGSAATTGLVASGGGLTCAIKIPHVEAALATGSRDLTVSFVTANQMATKIYFNKKVTINLVRAIVTTVMGGSDNGTITCADATGDMAGGIVTCVASAAIGTEYSATPTTHNVIAKDGYMKLTTAKTTTGGEALVSVEYTVTA